MHAHVHGSTRTSATISHDPAAAHARNRSCTIPTSRGSTVSRRRAVNEGVSRRRSRVCAANLVTDTDRSPRSLAVLGIQSAVQSGGVAGSVARCAGECEGVRVCMCECGYTPQLQRQLPPTTLLRRHHPPEPRPTFHRVVLQRQHLAHVLVLIHVDRARPKQAGQEGLAAKAGKALGRVLEKGARQEGPPVVERPGRNAGGQRQVAVRRGVGRCGAGVFRVGLPAVPWQCSAL